MGAPKKSPFPFPETPFKAHIEPYPSGIIELSADFTDPTILADAPCLCPVCGRVHSTSIVFLTRHDAEAAYATCKDGTTLRIPCVGECDLRARAAGLAPGWFSVVK